jgi:hypothetical protein
MTLPRWFLPLLEYIIRLYVRSLQVWSGSQDLRCSQPLAVRRDLPLSQGRPYIACPRFPHGRILIPVPVGWLFAVLALGQYNATSPLPISLGSAVSPVFGHAKAQLLAAMVPLDSPCDPSVLPDGSDDGDVGTHDSSAQIFLAITPHVITLPHVGTGFNNSTHANPWPFSYLARPQLLTRL